MRLPAFYSSFLIGDSSWAVVGKRALWPKPFAPALLAVGVALLASPGTAAGCESPAYSVALNEVRPANGNGSVRIVVNPKQLSVAGWVCLADRLREEHPEWKNVEVLAFTSAGGAAEKFIEPTDVLEVDGSGKPVRARTASGFANQVRAIFGILPTRESTSLVLTPAGLLTDVSYQTHIDLRSQSKPGCTLSLGERCVLEMGRLDVPAQAWRESFLGTVTLSGTARRDGTLSKIRIELMSGGADFAAVARDLAKSLESWRVDSGTDDDQFQVTVTYKFGGLPDLAVLEVTPLGITVIHVNQGIPRR